MTTKKKKAANVPNLRFPGFEGDWEKKKLGGLVDVITGIPLQSEEILEERTSLPILRGINITEGYIRHSKEIDRFYDVKNRNNVNKYLLNEGDLVIGMDGSKVGKNTAIISAKDAGSVLIQRVARMRPLGDVNINYIFQRVFSKEFQNYVDVVNTSSGIPHISLQQIKDFETGFPPNNAEHHKIASFLSLIDERIQTQNKIIEQLETSIKGIGEKLFSRKLRFKEFTGEWEEKTLGEIATFYSGGTPLTSKREFFDGDIPFIRSGEINSYKTEQFISELGLRNSSAKMVDVGNILYALYGATSGEVAISKISGAINQAVLCIKSSENHYFIYSYLLLKKDSITKTYLQGGQGNLSAEIVKQIKIPVPSTEEQNRTASLLAEIDQKIQIEQQILEKYEKQKKFLLQEMFV